MDKKTILCVIAQVGVVLVYLAAVAVVLYAVMISISGTPNNTFVMVAALAFIAYSGYLLVKQIFVMIECWKLRK